MTKSSSRFAAISFALLLAIAFRHNSAQSPSTNRRPAAPPAAQPITHLYQGDLGALGEPRRMLIQSQASLDAVIRAIGPELVRLKEPVDFERDEVIVAALGAQGGAGPNISIDSVIDEPPYRTIIVTQVDFVRGCTLGSAISRPVDIAVVRRLPFERVKFVDHATIEKCPP